MYNQKSLEAWAQRLVAEGNPLGETLLGYAKGWERESANLTDVAVA